MKISFRDFEILARTIWGEASGEDNRGKLLVGHVILNRVTADLGRDGKPDWWGEGIAGVCLDPYQFSCWNGGPYTERVRAVDLGTESFRSCCAAALIALEKPDEALGCTYYHNPTTTRGFPRAWGPHRAPTLKHGRHWFYNNIQGTVSASWPGLS